MTYKGFRLAVRPNRRRSKQRLRLPFPHLSRVKKLTHRCPNCNTPVEVTAQKCYVCDLRLSAK